MSQHAVNFAQQDGHQEGSALFEIRAPLREGFSGNAPGAKRTAIRALELAKNREVQYGAAFALALFGDSSRAQAIANDLERNFPEDTSVRFSYVPSVRAILALNHGQPAQAMEVLQIGVPYELG
jgi:predicted Zn-dependent protease